MCTAKAWCSGDSSSPRVVTRAPLLPSDLVCLRTNERFSWGRRNDGRKPLVCGGGGGSDEVGSSD